MSDQRYHGLDFVRAVAMLLGLSVHVNIFFFTENVMFWNAGEYHGDPINEGIAFFIFQFRMPLFFLLAGFFAALVIERKGLGHLTRDRIKRILIPFAVGVVFFAPLLHLLWCINTSYENVLVGVGLLERIKIVFFWGLLTDRDIPFNLPLIHLWFLYFLLIYYALHFLVRRWAPGLGGFLERVSARPLRSCLSHRWGIFLLPILFFPLRYSLRDPGINLNQVDFEVNALAIYGAYYLFGCMLFSHRQALETIARNSWFYLLMAIPVFSVMPEPTTRMVNQSSVVLDITNWKLSGFSVWSEGVFFAGWFKVVVCYLHDLCCLTLCFAFIGLAHRYLNRESRYTRYLADSSYWAYWVHVFIMFPIAGSLQLLGWPNSLFKAYSAFLVCTLIIYFLYQRLVRYTVLGDFFMGRRKDPADPSEAEFRMGSLIRLVARPVCLVGILFAVLGSMLHENSLRKQGNLLVEAYVARDRRVLEQATRMDDARDRLGNTPLHVAVRMPSGWRRYDPLPILIDRTENIDAPNEAGRTALFEAVRWGNTDDAEKLITAGSDLNRADLHGHTPAHVAAILTGSSDPDQAEVAGQLLHLLEAKGADLSLQDERGRTVKDCLRYFGRTSD